MNDSLERVAASGNARKSAGGGDGLDFDIDQGPDLARLTVRMRAGQKLFAEPSSMASMDSCIKLRAGLRGGALRSIGRAVAGESMVVNTYTAESDGEVVFAPGPMGDMAHYRLDGGTLLMQRGAFVAHSENVDINASWDGMRGFFSGEGMVLLRASGRGDIFFNTFGAILPVDVTDSYYVDTGYIVAFEDTLDYNVTVLPGYGMGGKIKSFFFGGEGLVCRFRGRGRLWVQTRAIQPYINWVHPFRAVKRRNDG